MTMDLKLIRDALEANHQHHQEHDDYDGYPDSELEDMNQRALAAVSQQSDAPAVATFGRRRHFPKDTLEFYGYLTVGATALPEGTMLYIAPPEVAALQAEIARLNSEESISEDVIDRMSKILADIAITLKGEEAARHRHGYQDLVEITQVNTLELELHRSQQFELQARIAELEAILSPDGRQIGVTDGADFDKGTWTFTMPPGYRVRAGEYYIIPIVTPTPESEQS